MAVKKTRKRFGLVIYFAIFKDSAFTAVKRNTKFLTRCRKIPKIRPEVYIFQRPFLRGFFLDRFIFGGVYVGREICV